MENKIKNFGLGRYLTYDQLNGRKKAVKNMYYHKLKTYNGGLCKLYLYKNPRYKSCNNPALSIHKKELSPEEQEKELERVRRNHQFEVKHRLQDYTLNNDFDMFWTLTFDGKKIEKDDDEYRFGEMRRWLEKMRKRYGKFNYIAVPERHKSGAIHWHVITGKVYPRLVDSGVIRRGAKVYNCPDWEAGFSDVQFVRSKKKVSSYITKYITKELVNSPVRKHKKKYWCSKGLELPKVRTAEELTGVEFGEPVYENDIVQIYEMTVEELTEFVRKKGVKGGSLSGSADFFSHLEKEIE